MGKVKRKTNNLQITTDAAGKEKIRFKGKFVKKLKVDRHLRGKMLSEMRKNLKVLKILQLKRKKLTFLLTVKELLISIVWPRKCFAVNVIINYI